MCTVLCCNVCTVLYCNPCIARGLLFAAGCSLLCAPKGGRLSCGTASQCRRVCLEITVCQHCLVLSHSVSFGRLQFRKQKIHFVFALRPHGCQQHCIAKGAASAVLFCSGILLLILVYMHSFAGQRSSWKAKACFMATCSTSGSFSSGMNFLITLSTYSPGTPRRTASRMPIFMR